MVTKAFDCKNYIDEIDLELVRYNAQMCDFMFKFQFFHLNKEFLQVEIWACYLFEHIFDHIVFIKFNK